MLILRRKLHTVSIYKTECTSFTLIEKIDCRVGATQSHTILPGAGDTKIQVAPESTSLVETIYVYNRYVSDSECP